MRWATLGGSSAPSGPASSGRIAFNSTGGIGGGGTIYHPDGGGGEAPEAAPGVFQVNPLDPQKTAGGIGQNLGSLLDGLRTGLFGTDARGAGGGLFGNGHGGLLGDIPLVGDVGRAVTGVPGVAANVVGGALKVASPLERIGVSGPGVDDEFNPIPDDFKKNFLATYKGEQDQGILGTGLLGTEGHVKAAAIRAYREEQQKDHPTLFGGRFTPLASLSDVLTDTMDLFGASADIVQRAVAGAGKPGDEGRNRLEQIMYVGDSHGKVAFTADSPGLTPIEQLVYQKKTDGSWSDAEALDFLSAHGAGYSHQAGLQIAASVALDPLNAAGFGAAGLAKLGASGAKLAQRAEKAASLLEEAQTGLKAAEAAGDAAEVTRLTEQVAEAQKTVKAFDVYQSANTPRRINALARSTQGSENAAAFLKLAGRTYGGLQGTAMGRMAKLTRTIIDPLHAIDLHMPGSTRMLDVLSDALPKSIAETLGDHHHLAVLEDLTSLDFTGAVREQFSKDMAVAAANRGREGAAVLHRAGMMVQGLGERLMQKVPGDVIEEAISSLKEKDLLRWLRYDATKNVLQRDWDEAAKLDLASRLEATYGLRSADEWMKRFETASIEEMSLLKFGAYGSANRRLLDGVGRSKLAGQIAVGNRSVDDMVLIAKDTLSRVGADSLVAKLDKAKGVKSKIALIEEWQRRFPALRYVAIDEANPGRSIQQFEQWLGDNLERFPMLVTHDELKALHPDLQDLKATLGEGYSLGFKPRDEFLWGLERSNEAGGAYRVATAPWVDHVADAGIGYRPGRAMRLNIAGKPVVDGPIKAAAKAIDYIEAGARVVKAQVSSAQITEVARQRFVSQAVRGELEKGGLTEGVAQKWWERIQEYTAEHQGYSGPRGFAKGDLYNALFKERLIPQTLLNGATRLTENDVLRMVMQAYDGDIRFIGLTQKLSGRVKRVLFEKTGTNFAGQISEHAWPLLKFRYNPIFQLQEKIEPWVLNAQRGISVATGVKASEADLATERLLQRLTDNSLIRQADLDQAEFSSQVLLGKGYDALGKNPSAKLGRINSMSAALLEVQGVKRLNMLRTFRAGLGKELRGAWEGSRPGEWDQMKELADLRAGRLLDDDEFAVHMMGEQLFANDIVVSRVGKTAKKFDADWGNAIKTGVWHTPSNLGELRALDLDHVAASLRVPGVDGKPIEDLGDLRRYIAENPKRLDEVTEGLNRLGADPDYVTRVENALSFSWTGFWKTAAERFSLTKEDSRSLQDMVAGAAELRDMAPADFLSQVFSPSIIDGEAGILGSLSKAADLRSQLAGKAGVSTREDMVRQMASVFSDFLDPSAKKALLMEFKPELRQAVLDGKVRLDLEDLKTMWGDVENSQLAERITGYMDGKLGTGAHTIVADETRGVAAVRKVANRYMESRGVTPHAERRYYEVDQPLYEDSARAYSALPEVPFEKTGRAPNRASINKAGLDLKPKPDGVDDRTYEAYQDFVADTRQQWDFMVRPKKDGGLGLDVSFSAKDPYPDSAAMRADVARGKLRVFSGGSDHPLMTNEQNAMFRAVHDVFGHAAEGFEFGPRGELNAAIKHSQMYSDTGRAAMLTETHGQTSWVNFSDEPVPGQAFTPAATWDEARTAYKANFPDVTDVAVDRGHLQVVWDYETAIGDGIESLARNGLDGDMTELVNSIHALRAEFPQVPLPHIDAVNLDEVLGAPGVSGLAVGMEDGKTALLFNSKMWTDPNTQAKALRGESEFARIKEGEQFIQGGEVGFRHTSEGTPFARGAGEPIATVYHEYGHAIDSWLRYGKPGIDVDKYDDFAGLFTDMSGSAPKWIEKAQKQLSEYAKASDEEGMAELLGVALNPATDRAALQPELRRAVEQVEKHLDDMGLRAKPVSGTVREANAVKRGTVYAPQKAGILDQSILDRFGEQFVGRGKHVESNPDVARAAQEFGKWSSKVVEDGLLKGEQSVHAGLLHDIAGIPTKDAVPYNLTEGLILQAATDSMVSKWQDAFRLQYFAQERSMLERSINHPMFGLYPASYMWGKLGPEVVRFLAQRPFGIRTGAVAHSLTDVQASVALQREFDPGFDAAIEKMGHSQALSFLGYLLPTLPWDVSASAPAWMKDIASQGLKSEAAVAAGGKAEGFNALKPTVDTLNKLNPLSTTLPWLSRAVGEVTTSTDRQDLAQQPVQGADLGTTLSAAMEELRASLSR